MAGATVSGMLIPHQLPTDAQQEEKYCIQQVFVASDPAVHVCEVIVHEQVYLLLQFV